MILNRVLEPELMDSPEEARDYDAMDHAGVNSLFVTDLLAAAPELCGAGEYEVGEIEPLRVLDLGTGTARIPIELCRRSSTHVRILAVDQAVSMLDLARYNVEVAGQIERIQLAQADAKQLPFEKGLFQVTISNSIVHHIPEPLSVLRQAAEATAPGGLLFFRDLLRPADEESLKRLVETYAGEESEHAKKMFADSLHAGLGLEEIQSMIEQLGFAPETVTATSDRHWTWSARTKT